MMFPLQVRLTASELARCDEIGRQRQAKTGHLADAYGLPANERLQRHVQGARAEKAVAMALGLPWTPVVDDYRDIAGNDVGHVGVRATDYHSGCLILHPKDEDDRPFVLVRMRVPDFWLMGWIYGREGKVKRYWRTGVRYPAYFVPQPELRWSPIP